MSKLKLYEIKICLENVYVIEKLFIWIFYLKFDENFFYDIIVSRNLKKIIWLL